ncbi:MAG: hypothetical protein V8Q43_03290 [Christensenellaceae bacterium]
MTTTSAMPASVEAASAVTTDQLDVADFLDLLRRGHEVFLFAAGRNLDEHIAGLDRGRRNVADDEHTVALMHQALRKILDGEQAAAIGMEENAVCVVNGGKYLDKDIFVDMLGRFIDLVHDCGSDFFYSHNDSPEK